MKRIILGALTLLLALNANATLINIYESNSNLSSIAQSQSVIDSAISADTSIISDNIFFSDWGHHGASAFPGGHNNTFVLTASGMIDTSLYSGLQFFHDDGIEVNLGGDSLYTYDSNTGLRNSGWKTFADTGMTSFDLLFWENGGAASILVYGQLRDGHTTEVANFSAVSVPEPSTIAILSIGLLGLAARKTKKSF
ncbi:PEP-CTERM sorting domain-containing protein [Colwellia psychrerythraea]|uniref:PEP motif putative anchor domain protein n=1 Tax=Colwellia psychrerythraea TaxID=28229 RepID=A0A099KXR8_COLPS|nr:PEP-CTERM sorting domain-containing protein [Colwellia psychrerythraea]KGJ94458.1 PEP motif putative anchor domain protein [Colwellia psychrerythraea]